MTRRLVSPNGESDPSRSPVYRPAIAGGVCIGVPIRSQSASTTRKIVYRILTTDLLIPGDDEPQPDSAVVVHDKLIDWVGPTSAIPDKYTSKPHKRQHVPFMMPGLWDCHSHFYGPDPNAAEENNAALMWLNEHPVSNAARLTRGCWEAVQRGYTSMRDCGGYGCEISKAIEDGSIVGPNVYSAGSVISQTAGHGDIFGLPAGDALLNLGISNVTPGFFGTQMSCMVDGVDECRRAIRLQIRRGAKCIKIAASGGVLSRDDNPLYAQFSPEELQVMVEEATRMERPVAAHVHGKAGILAAVKAGVSSVEHVTFADEECVDLIKEKGVIFVATRTIVKALVDSGGEGIPKKIWDKVKLVESNHLNAYKLAIRSGVTCALGSDTAPGADMALELQYAVEAGMSNLEAIKAATVNAALTVKAQAPLTGQIKAGYEADILGLLSNPAEDVKVLQDRDNIRWVWKGGRMFKGPGVGPWGEDSVYEPIG